MRSSNRNSAASGSSFCKCSVYCIFTVLSGLGFVYFTFLLSLLVLKPGSFGSYLHLRKGSVDLSSSIQTASPVKNSKTSLDNTLQEHITDTLRPETSSKQRPSTDFRNERAADKVLKTSGLLKQSITQVQPPRTIKIHVQPPRLTPRPTSTTPSKNSFPGAISFVTSHIASNPAVLVVGGTDGSGTRRVVQTLTELGVKMVSEDPETFDIHADLVGGWPTIVRPIIEESLSLSYQPKSLSRHDQNYQNVRKLLDQVKSDSTKPTSHKLAVGGVLPLPKDTSIKSNYVQYGFKAPVAMTMVPYWADYLDSFLFVHVVRDGRDIAFSVNQGPVDKFFATFYKNRREELNLNPNLKAIKLWSDWNMQVYEWSKKYYDDHPEHKDFGYILTHTGQSLNKAQCNKCLLNKCFNIFVTK